MSDHIEDKNWDRVSKLLRDADCVPEAPDCRQTVMAHIASRPGRSPLLWAYGLAAVLIAVVACMGLLPHSTSTPPVSRIASKPAPPAPNIIRQNTPIRQIAKAAPIIRERVTNSPARPTNPVHERTADARPQTIPQTQITAQSPDKPAPAPIDAQTPAPSGDRPVAIAVVTWPSARDEQQDSYSYGYKDSDTATGKTTECRVKRSGNSVEIYMESKPEAKELPVKGSVENETKPSA